MCCHFIGWHLQVNHFSKAHRLLQMKAMFDYNFLSQAALLREVNGTSVAYVLPFSGSFSQIPIQLLLFRIARNTHSLLLGISTISMARVMHRLEQDLKKYKPVLKQEWFSVIFNCN